MARRGNGCATTGELQAPQGLLGRSGLAGILSVGGISAFLLRRLQLPSLQSKPFSAICERSRIYLNE